MLSDGFSVPGRMRLSLSGQVPLVVFCGIANRKLFDFDALRVPMLLAKAFSDEKLQFFNVLCNTLIIRQLCLNVRLCVWLENAKRGLLYAKSIAFMMQNGTNHGTNSLLSVCKTDDLLAILHQFCERKLMKWDFSRCQINIRLKSVFQITENSVHNYPPCLPCEKAKKSLPSVS